MDLSEMNGRALDAFADMLEPASLILADTDVRDQFRAGKRIPAIRTAIKKHKKEVVEVLAALDGVDPAEYKVNVWTLPKKLIEIFNDPEVAGLFSFPSPNERPSGDTSENIADATK